MLLENIHIDILKFGNIYVENHVTQFLKLLKGKIPALEKSYVDKKVTIFSISAADVLISEFITDCFDFYQSLLEVFLPLQRMMTPTSYTLKDSFVVWFQEKPAQYIFETC